MSKLDLIIRGGTVVTDVGVSLLDVSVAEGRIVDLVPELHGDAKRVLDASGLHVLPGLMDSHVHFNEPGRTEWEGIATGSRALAAGGGTLFFDMPLNSDPPTVDKKEFETKRAAAEKSSVTDFALWGGLLPGKVDRLEELAECGVVGFKAFMCHSGIAEFPRADDRTLRVGMKHAAALGSLVAVHAESESLTRELTGRAEAAGRRTARDFLDSRPVRAELEAIERAIQLAGETGCALHIVHVSCGAGVASVVAARQRGVDVTCETCPHYLTLTDDDLLSLGAVAKCAPPLRSRADFDRLWQAVLTGQVATIGSDHSPAPPEMKQDSNFFKVWGGISGAQHTLPLLLTEGIARGLELPSLCKLIAGNVGQRFGLPDTKGSIAAGADADFALVRLSDEFTVSAADLLYRHRQSPYVGRTLKGRVVETLLRGESIFRDGKIVSHGAGRLVKAGPARRLSD